MGNFNSSLPGFTLTSPESKSTVSSLQQENLDTETIIKNEVDINNNITTTETQLEKLLSQLLKFGVLIASAIVLLGGSLYLISHGYEHVDYHFFKGEPFILRSPAGVLKAASTGHSSGIIQFGLLLLIATPILRVIISLLTFLRHRDFKYIIITSLVMTALIYSLIAAYY